MKRLSKLTRVVVTGFTTGAVVLAATMPVAAVSESPAGRTSQFCTTLAATSSKIADSFESLSTRLAAARTAEDQKVAANRQKWDAEIAASRTKWDSQRAENFTALEAKATTSDRQLAVATYESAIINAVNVRRTANDAARDTFRRAVDDARMGRRMQFDSQSAAFTTAANAATSTAQAGCQADSTVAGGAAVRTRYVNDLKNARTTFQAQRKEQDKIADLVKQLITARDSTIKTNDQTFAAASKAAREALKTAFGSTDI